MKKRSMDREALKASLKEYVCKHRDEIISDLFSLVRIPSVAEKNDGELPFGKGVDEVLSASAKLFSEKGIPMQVRHRDGYAISVLEGEGAGIGVFAHGDVVPVTDDWIKTAPFEPLEENGFLFGRGIQDNKAGIAETLHAVLALRQIGYPIKHALTLYVGGCEEQGMKDMEAFCAKERMPRVSLVPDGSFPVGIGEKGLLRVDCVSKIPLREVKKLNGGSAYNVVLDRVEVETLKGDSFEEKGTPAHAAIPQKGVNAAHLAAKRLLEKGNLCENDREILKSFLDLSFSCTGEGVRIASEGIFGALTCANGMVRVREDGKLYFSLDIRYGNEVDPAGCETTLLQALEEKGFEGSVWENQPGFLLEKTDNRDLDTILEVCRDLFSDPDAKPYLSSGGTYARCLKNAYSMDNTPKSARCPDLPAGHGGAHQSDETLTVESLLNGTVQLALLIAALDGLDG